jgi:regulator of RNase E activity RraA
MDTLGQHYVGTMSPDMRPLWRTRAHGIARTCRYLPARSVPPKKAPEEYWEWVGRYYREVCPYPWMAEIEPGDFCVVDASGVDAGLLGSNNCLAGVRSGARGFVTSGGVRDTDEVILEKIPMWSPFVSQSMVQGRLRFDSKDVPVSVGGVLVHPGDVVVADGDGVIVVPRGLARDVAEHAHAEHRRDKAARRKLYADLGMELDDTVRDEREDAE